MNEARLHKGIWLFAPAEPFARDYDQGSKAIANMCDHLARGGFDLINLCVKMKDGYLSYATRIGIVNPVFAGWDPLEVFCLEAQKHNIKIHPWFCIHAEGEGSALLRGNTSVHKITKDGPTGAVCMMRDEAQDYEFSLYKEVMERYAIAGVHLDYIRTGAGMCVCDYCTNWVRRELGKVPSDIALNEGVEEFNLWCEWRTANITRFVKRIHDEAGRRNLRVSAAVLKDYPACIISNGQDWVEWAEKRIVDYLFPMNYSTRTAFVIKNARIHQAVVGDQCEVWQGLGTWRTIEQAQAMKQLGFKGVVFFQSKDKPLTDADLKALATM